jgi:hypothetical protein
MLAAESEYRLSSTGHLGALPRLSMRSLGIDPPPVNIIRLLSGNSSGPARMAGCRAASCPELPNAPPSSPAQRPLSAPSGL